MQKDSPALVIVEGGRFVAYRLDQRERWRLGRVPRGLEERPEIVLMTPYASRRHGELRRIDGQWFYVDYRENTNGTFRNTEKLPRAIGGRNQLTLLEDGDVLNIGPEGPVRDSRGWAAMVFLSRMPREGWARVALDQSRILIGSAPACGLRHRSLLPEEGALARIGGVYYLAPGEGASPVYRNGQPLDAPAVLEEGDHIRVGTWDMFFLGDGMLCAR